MPELPEVETLVRDLRAQIRGRKIVNAIVRWRRTIALPRAPKFSAQIGDQTITTITRRGKYLVFHLARGAQKKFLLVHLRMTGGFSIDPPSEPRDKHMHVIFQLDDGNELRFRDTRKFGRMWLVDEPARVTEKLGPEPLEISARDFDARVQARRGNLKPLLLEQKFIAGIGNIYADESLWYARLHPLRRAESLTRAERARLYRAIQKVLTRAIDLGGTSIDVMYKRVNGASGEFQNSLRAFDREKKPCRRCGTIIIKTVVGQRGTHFCPGCQKL
ncbi:MAG: DNA-formamidopyrimidine glycosylase [Chloroflexi bacterium]|nr:DNA-formamidopyrimidine glycosylase [Chloroflexota bacterium]